ncbi:cupin domain-containing protein [Actinomadura sp. 6K520]|uniref:cupin domain-containing protein n=1 Tax=Actinomadura sp. 6K520 TaxID=2530364 RepID=UPI00140443AD|nr:cupin domain-containing protein [Actinomadura sp. 6K520]
MSLIRTADRHKLTADNRPAGCRAHSAGRFRLRADGTSRFDRHHHDFDEFWFVATGSGTILLGDTELDVQPGDIIYTPAGTDHDVRAVTGPDDLHVFWLSWTLPDRASGQHLHRDPADAAGHLVASRRPA